MRSRNFFALLALGTLGVVSAGMVACSSDGGGGGSIVLGRETTNEMDVYADKDWKSCKAPAMATDDLKVSGPYSHENLEIYLVHGKEQVKPKREILTLEEALKQGKAVVHETDNVNQLSVENVSPDADIYVQSGDIVQGGKQDRVLAVDLMLSPKSGRVPIASYCVEHGRWGIRDLSTGLNQQFGTTRFGISSNSLSSLKLKKAVKVSLAQDEVWASVGAQQAQLADNLASEVRSPASGSSLQLTLETKAVKAATENYTKALAKVVDGKDDVLGFAAVVNGKITSADVYGSNKLFQKLWSKLLAASAVEAIAEKRGGKATKKSEPIGTEKVAAFLADLDQGKAKSKNVTARVQLVRCEGKSNHFFETRDRANGTAWLHRNYLPK